LRSKNRGKLDQKAGSMGKSWHESGCGLGGKKKKKKKENKLTIIMGIKDGGRWKKSLLGKGTHIWVKNKNEGDADVSSTGGGGRGESVMTTRHKTEHIGKNLGLNGGLGRGLLKKKKHAEKRGAKRRTKYPIGGIRERRRNAKNRSNFPKSVGNGKRGV